MWELQRHMESWIAPSIWAHLKTIESRALRLWWLANRYAEQKVRPVVVDDLPEFRRVRSSALELAGGLEDWRLAVLVEELVAGAIEIAGTTVGGGEFYLSSWCAVKWCDEEEMQQWWA